MWYFWSGRKWRIYDEDVGKILNKEYNNMIKYKKEKSKEFRLELDDDICVVSISKKDGNIKLEIKDSFFGFVFIKNVDEEMLRKAMEKTSYEIKGLKFYGYNTFNCFD